MIYIRVVVIVHMLFYFEDYTIIMDDRKYEYIESSIAKSYFADGAVQSERKGWQSRLCNASNLFNYTKK